MNLSWVACCSRPPSPRHSDMLGCSTASSDSAVVQRTVKRVFVVSFPYVCPEPVLANDRRFSYGNEDVLHRIGRRQEQKGAIFSLTGGQHLLAVSLALRQHGARPCRTKQNDGRFVHSDSLMKRNDHFAKTGSGLTHRTRVGKTGGRFLYLR